MNFTHFKRRGCNSVQDKSVWNCQRPEWHRDGFLFDSISFPPVSIIPPALHAHLHLNTAIIRRTGGRRLGTRYQKDDCCINNEFSASGALLCQKYSFAYRRALTQVLFFTLLRHKVFSILFAQNCLNVCKIWGLHYSEDSLHGVLNFNTVWTWWVLISVS